MSIFKNENEAAYVGGKKHWADVIKNSGDGNLLIWRQPEEDFNTNSTLIVMPGEEAIFIKGGIIEQTFENGTYKLSTENYPVISRLRNAFSGGVSTFSCVVYFVRKAHSKAILWGTSSPIQVRDPELRIQTNLQARGSYRVKVDNAVLFLEKLVGNNIFTFAQEELNSYFREEMEMHIKAIISGFVQKSQMEILGICAQQLALASMLEVFISEIFNKYGVCIENFSISGLDIPNADPNRQKLETAFAAKGEIKILGEDWGRQTAKEILSDLANNSGAGGIAAAGAGLGMGMAAGGVFGGMAQQLFNPMQQSVQTTPPQPIGGSRFTQKAAAEETKEAPMIALEKLKLMLEKGLIPQEKYDAKVQEILNRM